MAITEVPGYPRPPKCQHTGVDLVHGRCADCKRAYERWYCRTRRATDPAYAARRRILMSAGQARRKAARDAASAGKPNPSSSRNKHLYADYLELVGKAEQAERIRAASLAIWSGLEPRAMAWMAEQRAAKRPRPYAAREGSGTAQRSTRAAYANRRPIHRCCTFARAWPAMTTKRRYTNRELRAAIRSLESRGWSINTDGTITRVTVQTKYPVCDQRANREPRYQHQRGEEDILNQAQRPGAGQVWPNHGWVPLYHLQAGENEARQTRCGGQGAA